MSLELLEELDGFAALRNGLRRLAEERDQWSGFPMPLAGTRLVVEPSFPNAQGLMAFGAREPEQATDPALRDAKIRNTFWSAYKRSEIIIFERADGKIDWGLEPGANHLTHDLATLGCADAWGIEQEAAAMQLLATLLPHRIYKTYLLTGMFLVRSARSGVHYLFRRLKPTVAIHIVDGKCRIMCALCLHPLAHYEGSWAGAMCPSDDVIAHYILMSADEHMFWRKANQHPAWTPAAGV